MDVNQPPGTSWQMMREMKQAVGPSGVQKIFSVGQTQLNRYCRNPDFTADAERNTLDRLRMLFIEASDAGALEAVMYVANYIVEPLKLEIARKQPAVSDKATLAEGFADDVSAYSNFQRLCADKNALPSQRAYAKQLAIKELGESEEKANQGEGV